MRTKKPCVLFSGWSIRLMPGVRLERLIVSFNHPVLPCRIIHQHVRAKANEKRPTYHLIVVVAQASTHSVLLSSQPGSTSPGFGGNFQTNHRVPNQLAFGNDDWRHSAEGDKLPVGMMRSDTSRQRSNTPSHGAKNRFHKYNPYFSLIHNTI